MMRAIIMFVIGIVLLLKGTEWFSKGACSFSGKPSAFGIHIKELILSVCTLLPVISISSNAAYKGLTDISYGTVIGFTVISLSAIAALLIIAKPGAVSRNAFNLPLLFLMIALLTYAVSTYIFNNSVRIIGIVLLVLFAAFIVISVCKCKSVTTETNDALEEGKLPVWNVFLLMLFGAVLVIVGGRVFVDNAVVLSDRLGVPESVASITVLSIISAIPSISASVKSISGESDESVIGKLLRTTLFNLTLSGGIAMLIKPFSVPSTKSVSGLGSISLTDIPVIFLLLLLVSLPALAKEKTYRLQGILLAVIYICYLVFQFI